MQAPSRPIVIGYIRASKEEQTLSPAAQRAALEEWCSRRQADLVAVHQDLDVSGATPLAECPGLLAALADLKIRQAKVLLILRRDRLARDVAKAALVERLVQQGGAVVTSTTGEAEGDPSDPTVVLMRHILDAFAEYERLLIAVRTRAALQVKRSRGERVGRIPFGSRLKRDGRHSRRCEAPAQCAGCLGLAPDPEEQRALQMIKAEYAQGRTPEAIADLLRLAGHRPRSGRWHAEKVRRLLLTNS